MVISLIYNLIMIMPHLQFDISKKLTKNNKRILIRNIKNIFSKVMDTETYHIAISIREFDQTSIFLGRAKKNENVCLMNLDIRKGRSKKQKRKLVIKYIELFDELLKINKKNQYVIITEHKGTDFNLFEGPLRTWKKNDDPLKN